MQNHFTCSLRGLDFYRGLNLTYPLTTQFSSHGMNWPCRLRFSITFDWCHIVFLSIQNNLYTEMFESTELVKLAWILRIMHWQFYRKSEQKRTVWNYLYTHKFTQLFNIWRSFNSYIQMSLPKWFCIKITYRYDNKLLDFWTLKIFLPLNPSSRTIIDNHLYSFDAYQITDICFWHTLIL